MFTHSSLRSFSAGVPFSIQLINVPKLISSIAQQISTSVKSPYHPQSSGKAERTNRVKENPLTKLTLELKQDWIKLLPLALLKFQALLINLP